MGFMKIAGLVTAHATWAAHLIFFLYVATGKMDFGSGVDVDVWRMITEPSVENRFSYLASLLLALLAFGIGIYIAILNCPFPGCCCIKCCLNCLPCCCGAGCCPTFILTLVFCGIGAACDFAACFLQTGPLDIEVGSINVAVSQDFGYGILGLAGGLVAFVLFAVIYIVDCISCGGAVFGGKKKKTKTSSSKSKTPDADLQAV